MNDLAKELEGIERAVLMEETVPLHPAGGINNHFVYEPVGFGEYAFKTREGAKGIAQLAVEYEDEKNKKGPHWFITVEGQPYYFKRKPEKTWVFETPDKGLIKRWVSGEKKSSSLEDLWPRTQVYFKTFLDLPKVCEHSILNLGVVQSWVSELLSVLFYVGIQGEFGGGKTVAGEAIVAPCRHGFSTGNLSPAFCARVIERQKTTLFVDELDSVAGTKDSDLYQVFRQGYRRGGMYSRVNPNSLKTEIFEVFGPKIFTVHASVEQALSTRAIPLHVRETGNAKYPIINVEKVWFGKKLMEEYFLWYLDAVFNLKENSLEVISSDVLDLLDGLDRLVTRDNINEKAENIRNILYKRKIRVLQRGQVNQVSQFSGRNVELAYQAFVLSNFLGVDIDQDIVEVFKQKATEEGEPREIGLMGALKDVLTKAWEEKRTDESYQTEDGMVKVSNKELYFIYNKTLKEEGYSGVSPHTFKGYLTEFGFSDVLNRKKLTVPIPGDPEPKSRLCNIFTPRVLRKLEIEESKPTAESKSTQGLLKFEQVLSGPSGLTGELFHKGICKMCGRQKNIEFQVVDFNRESHEICAECAWAYSGYLEKKGEG